MGDNATYLEWPQRVRIEAERLLRQSPQCHGWDHTVRVWRNARRLAQAEAADSVVAECAALLHDIGRADEDASHGGTCHAEAGARRVPSILRAIGVEDAGFVRRVAECVRTHRYRRSKGQRPATLEAKVVYDADKLDSMGAIGIARSFHFAGRIGARVHNRAQEALAAESYSVDDTGYREFLVKLRHLKGEMLTREGRRMAEQRHRFMAAFFERLQEETGDQEPSS